MIRNSSRSLFSGSLAVLVMMAGLLATQAAAQQGTTREAAMANCSAQAQKHYPGETQEKARAHVYRA